MQNLSNKYKYLHNVGQYYIFRGQVKLFDKIKYKGKTYKVISIFGPVSNPYFVGVKINEKKRSKMS